MFRSIVETINTLNVQSSTSTSNELLKSSYDINKSISHSSISEAGQNLTSNTFVSNNNNNKNINMSNSHQDVDRWYEIPKMENITDVFTICCSIAVIFGGLVPYIPQYLKIKQTMSSDGFSTYVCLTLLLANILRIMFWCGHRFELPLLIQSFVIIAGMVAMMELCIRVREKRSPFTISAIGVSGQNSHRRRSLNGKLEDESDANERDNESTPIYSVLPTTSAVSSNSVSPTNTIPDSFSFSSYHHQLQADSIEVTTEAMIEPISATNHDNHIENSSCESPTTSTIDGEFSQHQCRSSLLDQSQSNQPRIIKCRGVGCFWDWDDYFSYIKFLSLFTLIMGLSTYLLLDNYLYVEGLGFVAVFTESMLGMPQLVRNHRKKSTKGMSVEMVIMWLSGDLFKTLYFIIRRAPAQFYVCGSIQVIVDILILCQVLWYRRPTVTYRKLPKST